MDQNQLLSAAVELALDLLEKNGTFLPFCKAVNDTGETFVYTPASDTPFTAGQAFQSVLSNVKRDLDSRRLQGAAFCFHSRVRLSGATEKVPAVEVEIHFRGLPSAVWYFLYKMDGKKATVLEYYQNDAAHNLFS
jgi:hypothetical protein